MSLINSFKNVNGHIVYEYDDVGQINVDKDYLVDLTIRVPVDSYHYHTVEIIPCKDLNSYYVNRKDIVKGKNSIDKMSLEQTKKYIADLYDKKSAYVDTVAYLNKDGKVERVEVYKGVKHELPTYRITGIDRNGKRFSIDTKEPHNYNFYEITNVWKLNSDGTKNKVKDGDIRFNTLEGHKIKSPSKKSSKCPFGLNFRGML